jgi:hypothetical protein
MATFSDYEKLISAQLQPLRTLLASGNIPIASLPKEAAKFTQKYPGSLRVLVGHSYRGKTVSTGGQEREVDVAIFIRLSNRYDDAPPETRSAAIDWVENEVVGLLLGFLLPTAATELNLASGRLLPPEEGEWQKEIVFKFSDYLEYRREETPTLSLAKIVETQTIVR